MQVRREISQITDESILAHVQQFKDALGEIDKPALCAAVCIALEGDTPYVVMEIRDSALPFFVDERMRTLFRQNKRPARKTVVASDEREYVCFRDANASIVTKARSDLLKSEIPLYRAYHLKFREGHDREIQWCDEVWNQMELLNFSDDTPIRAAGY